MIVIKLQFTVLHERELTGENLSALKNVAAYTCIYWARVTLDT